ncbi:MAG: endonuclease/exonuclease/phosphatase family protein, partial [Alphaproteobacteria bacterium]
EHHQRVPFEGGPWSGIDDESERNWTNGESEPACPTSAIWMGDFNAEPGSTEYKRMTGPSPYYANPGYRDRFVDSTVAAGHAPDAFISHTGEDEDGVTRSRRLDYCFVSSDLASRVRRMWVDEACIASDHKPVWTELDFEGIR